ncbi:hypothetical protein BDZ89DRAFT_1091498 [Hymenopellis radicata]|nr:hypothetical protein BDZ89DRAFT_1091498 [Hymenopellis radicata]
MQVPSVVKQALAPFPLHTYPPIRPKRKQSQHPTLWIHPPNASDGVLSADVECLKWQAYLALRGVSGLRIRTDVDAQGSLDGRLPCLQADSVSKPGQDNLELHAAHHIPGWADAKLGQTEDDPLEGYRSEAARDESRAWVSLLEGNVHAALLLAQPTPSFLFSVVGFDTGAKTRPIESILTPPPPPRTGITSLLPPLPIFGFQIPKESVAERYQDAVSALSERLGTDRWFLSSDSPTPLDALVFAYLHCILNLKDGPVRQEVTRRVNLVAWEYRVRSQVIGAFTRTY